MFFEGRGGGRGGFAFPENQEMIIKIPNYNLAFRQSSIIHVQHFICANIILFLYNRTADQFKSSEIPDS